MCEKSVYPTHENVFEKSKELYNKYDFLKMSVVGYSCLGRELFTLSLGNTQNAVLFASAFHSQEWLTACVLMRFCENLCEDIQKRLDENDDLTKQLLNDTGIIFVPLVNPDGVEIALNGAETAGVYKNLVEEILKNDSETFNANARGVDINHNFNAGWKILRKMETELGITGPSARRFGGISPESEPETRALTELCQKVKPRLALALHSQGEEIYWEYGENTPKSSLNMAKILALSSGYTLAQPEKIASHGGFKDWFIDYFSKPAFTIEIGKGKNPLDFNDFDLIYKKIEEMLKIASLL